MDRYEEAIIKMRDFVERYKYYTTSEGGNMYKDLINIFPELAESEDEKIRKEIISALKYANHKGVYDKHLDWLEKQGENSIYNVPSREVILAIWDLGNEWKELTNGSISTEYGTQLAYIQKHWEESEYYLREKQGNTQKEASYTYEAETGNGNIKALVTEKVQLPKFKVGDEIKTDNEELLTITKIDEKGYWSEDLLICGFDDAAKWELVEQKPAWSEKDAGYIKDLISYFSQNEKLGNTKEDVIAWLKSLKERVQL